MELNVPMAKITVFDTRRLYLSTGKPPVKDLVVTADAFVRYFPYYITLLREIQYESVNKMRKKPYVRPIMDNDLIVKAEAKVYKYYFLYKRSFVDIKFLYDII